MSGYSQGAQVVHKAAALVGSGMASISSIVTFGDPGLFDWTSSLALLSLARTWPDVVLAIVQQPWNSPLPRYGQLADNPTDSKKAVTGIDPSKVLVICHDRDDICQFGDLLTLKHFTYAKNVTEAAAFVASHL